MNLPESHFFKNSLAGASILVGPWVVLRDSEMSVCEYITPSVQWSYSVLPSATNMSAM